MTESTTAIDGGFVLDLGGFEIFPGMFFDNATSTPTAIADMQLSAFYETEAAGLPVGTLFFTGVDPAQNYTTSDPSLGFGSTININEDTDSGFVSYGCIGDADGDGSCDGDEGLTDDIDYDAGTTSGGTPVTLQLALPRGTDYCDSGLADMPAPSTQVKDVYVEMDWGGGAHDPHIEHRKLSNNALKVDGPQNLCDMITTFDESPALSSLGGEAGIKLRILGDNAEDITSGGHLDELSVWTDQDFNLTNNFNAVKLQFLGDSSLRPILSGTIMIGDGGATTATDSVTISGLSVASPPGTSGERTKGEIRTQVHVTLDNTGESLVRTSNMIYDIAHASGGAALTDFEILVGEITATVNEKGGLELLDVTIPYEIRNEATSDGTYSIGTITVPFDTTGGAVETAEALGWNSPSTVSTKMEAYSQFVHYGLVVHSLGPCGASGVAEQDQNDFVLALGCKLAIWESYFTTIIDANDGIGNKRSIGDNEEFKGTFLHELGHNFGLKHGGANTIEFVLNYGTGDSAGSPDPFDGTSAIVKEDLTDAAGTGPSDGIGDNVRHFQTPPFSNPNSGVVCKPNYVSIMSYARQLPHTLKGADFDADYSSGHVAGKPGDASRTLKEGALNEARGLPADTWFDDKVPEIVFGVPQKRQGSTYAAPNLSTAGEVGVDWNDDSVIVDAKQRENINSLSGIAACGAAGTAFNDWNDWWNMKLDFAGIGGQSFDGVVVHDENEWNFADNDGAGSTNEWYDGLIYFNTLKPGGNPDTDNVAPSGSRFDIGGQLLTCEPNNDPAFTDLCIDTGLSVKRAFFYQDPLNAREPAPAICIGNNGTPGDPTDDDFNRPDCVAAGFIELKPINGEIIKATARECTDATCDDLTGPVLLFVDDGAGVTAPSHAGFHQHDDDGVYHFSVLVDEIEAEVGSVAGKSFAFVFDRQSGDTGILFDLNETPGIDFIDNAGGDQVTVIISFEA